MTVKVKTGQTRQFWKTYECFVRLTPWANSGQAQAYIGSRAAGNRERLCSLRGILPILTSSYVSGRVSMGQKGMCQKVLKDGGHTLAPRHGTAQMHQVSMVGGDRQVLRWAEPGTVPTDACSLWRWPLRQSLMDGKAWSCCSAMTAATEAPSTKKPTDVKSKRIVMMLGRSHCLLDS